MPLAACNVMSGAVTARTLDRATVVLTQSVTVAEMICERGDRREVRSRGREEGEMVNGGKEERELNERDKRRGEGREKI